MPVLADLHRLPVRHRINFKIATIAFKVLHFQQPSHFATLVPRYVPTRYCDLLFSCRYVFSFTKNCNGKVLAFLIRCLGHLELVTMSSFILFRSSCFQEETRASSFFEFLPHIFSPFTDTTLCDITTSTNVNPIRCTLPLS